MIAIMFDDLAPFLHDLKKRELAVAARDTVFRQGDAVRQMFFVTAGEVHLVRHQESGAPLVLQRARPGAILAEASLYARQYHCDAVAVSASTLTVFAKAELAKRIAENAGLAEAMIRRFGHELQSARFHAEVLSMKTVAARVDAWLGWRGALPPKGAWAQLAAELGVSPEALYRELGKRR